MHCDIYDRLRHTERTYHDQVSSRVSYLRRKCRKPCFFFLSGCNSGSCVTPTMIDLAIKKSDGLNDTPYFEIIFIEGDVPERSIYLFIYLFFIYLFIYLLQLNGN